MRISEITLHGPSNTVSFKILREGLPGHRVTVQHNGDPEYVKAEINRQLVGFSEKPDLTEVLKLAEVCSKPEFQEKVTYRPEEPG